ncbi:MAG: NADH-quinone oxidoreductase subunit NuoK [Deltaproteobacteria bacterium]|nr:NADH-quinone oxidoreductase subunit NuoK [Deltaproteobacteria bacterium]
MPILQHYLTITAILFCLGLYNVITRKSAVGLLIGVELILNAAALNFVVFAHFNGNDLAGSLFAIFIIILAAAEAAVALAIVVAIFQQYRDIDTTQTTLLKG